MLRLLFVRTLAVHCVSIILTCRDKDEIEVRIEERAEKKVKLAVIIIIIVRHSSKNFI